MHTLAVTGFLFVLAELFAIFEIEGEGKYGWAEKFPTWYRVNGFVPKLYTRITSKTLTGYHAALFFVPFMIFFWPMIQESNLTWHGTFYAFATYFAWVVVWDFSWFVLNPSYGVRKFRKNKVWWFAQEPWLFGRIPLGYILAWVNALALSAIGGWVENGNWSDGLIVQIHQLLYYVGFVFALYVIGEPLFHRYYKRMRRPGTDERSQAGIFHDDGRY